MTLPDERYRAVLWAQHFLIKLCDPTLTPRIPKQVRLEASSILRHFPSPYDMDRASEGSPDVFQPRMEELYRMIKKYEEGKENA